MKKSHMKGLLVPDNETLTAALVGCQDARFFAQTCEVMDLETGPGKVLVSAAMPSQMVGSIPVVDLIIAHPKVGSKVSVKGSGVWNRIAGRKTVPSPFLAVGMQAWETETASRSIAALFPTVEAYKVAVREALTLNVERMRAAQLTDGRVLMLAEDPSLYWILRLVEKGAASVYWRGRALGVYLPWGYTHPLSSRFAGLELGDDLFFANTDGTWERISSPSLQDVYRGLKIEIPNAVTERMEGVEKLPQVPVALQWGFRPVSQEGTIWVLDQGGHDVVEQLLSSLPESELQTLQLSVGTDRDGGGEELFVIRRLAAKTTETLNCLELPGQPYASYAGYGNFFVPANRHLTPPIRTERFRGLLSLQPSELVLLRPRGESGFTLSRIPEYTFRPLESLVEYRVQAEEERLRDLRTECVFEFEELHFTPPRSIQAQPSKSFRPHMATFRGLGEEGSFGSEDEPEEPAPAPKLAVVKEVVPVVPDPVTITSDPQDTTESDLEDEALSGKSAAAWLQLALFKLSRGRVADALFAVEEAVWLDNSLVGKYQEMLETILNIRDVLPSQRFETVTKNITRENRAYAARYLPLILATSVAGADVREVFNNVYTQLRESVLRKKSRWMAWSGVLAQNGDISEQERQREEILGVMARRGIEHSDRPSFLSRYLHSKVGSDDWQSHVELPEQLDLLATSVSSFPEGPARQEAELLLLRTQVETDRDGKAESLVQGYNAENYEGNLSALSFLAGAASFVSADASEKLFRQVCQELGKSVVLRDTVFANYFENLLIMDAACGTHTLVPESMQMLSSLPADQLSRLLPELVPYLLDLGVREEALDLIRATMVKLGVESELYLMERALVSLTRALGDEPLAPADLDLASNALLNAGPVESFDILYLDMLEQVTLSLGESFLTRIRETIDPASKLAPYYFHVLNALQARLHFESGRASEGLTIIENNLSSCLVLSDPSRSRAMGRYIKGVAHSGNVTRGGEILKLAVKMANNQADMTDFFRGEVLGSIAWSAGQLGDGPLAVEILTEILDEVETRLTVPGQDMSLIFEVLSRGMVILCELGEWDQGGDLIQRIEQIVRERIDAVKGVQKGSWFFLHRARVVCARTLLYMGRDTVGGQVILQALEGFNKVTVLDRTDLLEETTTVLPLLDGEIKTQVLRAMADHLQLTDDLGDYDRGRRAAVVLSIGKTLRPGVDAYRRELVKWDALESREIRNRVASERPAAN